MKQIDIGTAIMQLSNEERSRLFEAFTRDVDIWYKVMPYSPLFHLIKFGQVEHDNILLQSYQDWLANR